MPVRSGRLNIVVLGAKFSPERKSDHGLSCKLAVGKQKKKTHPNSNHEGEALQPQWNESFSFDVPEGIIALKMSLKEKALIGDHVIGSCVVPLYLLPTKTREEKWFELKKKDTVIGEIQIRVQFLPNESLKKISEQGELPLVARSMSSFTGIGEKDNNNEEDPTSSLRCLSAQELASPLFASSSSSMSFIPSPVEPFHPPLLNTLLVSPREGAKSARMSRTESEMFTKVEKTADLLSFNIFRSLHDKRKTKKSNLFRMLFGLPETEELLFDVPASYVKRGNPLLIHGKIYVSQSFVCFFSNIFGIKTMEVISMDEIVGIEKQQAEGLEPGVVISTKGSLYYFATFGSHKEKLYGHLMAVWQRDQKEVLQQEEQDAREAQQDSSAGAAPEGEEEEEEEDEYLSPASFTGEAGFLSAEKMTELINEEFPVSVLRFFKLFFSDEAVASSFLQTYHDKRGDTEFKILAPWSNHPRFGTTRELQYRSPVNAPLGPKTTINAETQRYSLQKDNLIVETISVLRDIPFGESFRVEGRWNVTTSGKNLCRVILKVGVYFSKRVFLRGTIEEKTIKESAESYKIWLGLAKEEAKRGPPIGSSASGSGISLTGTGRVSPQTSQVLSDSPNNRSGRSSPSKVSPTTSAVALPSATSSTIGVTSTKTPLSKPTTTTPSPSLPSTSAADSPFSSTKPPSTTRGFLAPVLMIVSVILLFWVLYLTWRVSTVTSKLAAFERLLADDFSHHSVTNGVGIQ